MHHASFHLDIKSLSDAGQIVGLAARYGNMDADGESFEQGAFAKSAAAIKMGGRLPAMLLHHDRTRPVGRWDSFEESVAGLIVQGQIALEANDGRDAYALVKGGALNGLSVGFRTIADKIASNVRVITEAELFEVSLVAVPSNPMTRIDGVKSLPDVRGIEEMLRNGGISGRKAKAAASAAWRALQGQDAEHADEAKLAEILKNATTGISRYQEKKS